MIIMNEKGILSSIEAIRRVAPDLGGVFSAADLANLIGGGSALRNARARDRLVTEGVLVRVQRGIYAVPACDLWVLAMRISPRSYISMDTALARSGLVGTVAERSVRAIHPLRHRVITSSVGRIEFHALKEELFFGTRSLSNGVRVADDEKAFLDLLAFHLRGVRFPIDPLRDVAVDRLDRKKLEDYLRRYANPKFISFVKGVIREE